MRSFQIPDFLNSADGANLIYLLDFFTWFRGYVFGKKRFYFTACPASQS
jgi:hypothetical protein